MLYPWVFCLNDSREDPRLCISSHRDRGAANTIPQNYQDVEWNRSKTAVSLQGGMLKRMAEIFPIILSYIIHEDNGQVKPLDHLLPTVIRSSIYC